MQTNFSKANGIPTSRLHNQIEISNLASEWLSKATFWRAMENKERKERRRKKNITIKKPQNNIHDFNPISKRMKES